MHHSGELPKSLSFLSYLSGKIHIGEAKEVIPSQQYETTDIHVGAFFLCKGVSLHGIRSKDAARGIAAFEISGNNLDHLEREYRSGTALVNSVHLRESLNMLRDTLFDL
ncbi:MAG: hypothetical protein CSA20_01590 [Deltaproteobacteria bacterium]|nr:MAG: hypothetical protein CSA20_01590 [Deltaproteobacteria bacterium]